MNELNMSSYIQTMQLGLMTHDKQEAAGVFLLSAINDHLNYHLKQPTAASYEQEFNSKSSMGWGRL